jgi:DNA modification methylase/transcriptional regulator with XRE-family HTH domain
MQEIRHGDCLAVMREMPDVSVDAVVTDPPYGLAFMGKRWDYDVPSEDVWHECLRVLKPGGHLLAFAGTRTQHRMAVRIEDAGFEIRDMIAWVYGSGFPKSLDVSKAIDKAGGASPREQSEILRAKREAAGLSREKVAASVGCTPSSVRDWEEGRARATGAAVEFIVPSEEYRAKLADLLGYSSDERRLIGAAVDRRGDGTVYAVGHSGGLRSGGNTEAARQWQGWGTALKPALEPITVARKPLIGTVAENVLAHGTGALNVDGCRVATDDVLPKMSGKAILCGSSDGWNRPWKNDPNGLVRRQAAADAAIEKANTLGRWPANLIHDGSEEVVGLLNDAARFFYCAKASKADRGDDNNHPTVKPTDLMRYLCRLVTPPGGIVLDPFAGSGSTGKAAALEGFRFIGIEREAEYVEIARARIAAAVARAGLFERTAS